MNSTFKIIYSLLRFAISKSEYYCVSNVNAFDGLKLNYPFSTIATFAVRSHGLKQRFTEVA